MPIQLLYRRQPGRSGWPGTPAWAVGDPAQLLGTVCITMLETFIPVGSPETATVIGTFGANVTLYDPPKWPSNLTSPSKFLILEQLPLTGDVAITNASATTQVLPLEPGLLSLFTTALALLLLSAPKIPQSSKMTSSR